MEFFKLTNGVRRDFLEQFKFEVNFPMGSRQRQVGESARWKPGLTILVSLVEKH